MKKILLSVFLLVFAFAASAQNSSQSYIEKFKDNAIRIMHQSGVPASIILAVAMHESANGNSKLARNYNNHFGVKGRSNVAVPKKTHSSYKQYDSALESFQDFAHIMTERKHLAIWQLTLVTMITLPGLKAFSAAVTPAVENGDPRCWVLFANTNCMRLTRNLIALLRKQPNN